MEFLLLLTSIDKEILDLVYKAKFTVEENTPLCLLGEKYFGFLKIEQKTIVICTHNAKRIGGYYIPKASRDDDFDQTSLYIRKALRHEAVHVAQSCNNGRPLGFVNNKKFKLHPYKENALKASTKISGNKEKEYEAYWMEDKPKIVKSSLIKYCL